MMAQLPGVPVTHVGDLHVAPASRLLLSQTWLFGAFGELDDLSTSVLPLSLCL